MIKPFGITIRKMLIIVAITCVAVVYSDANLFSRVFNLEAIAVDFTYKPGEISFLKDVKPILDARCIACHSCYDSPCQLKLTAYEGIGRGASKKPVYDHERLKAVEPTRLFIDETSTPGWRTRGFFPVLNETGNNPEANLNNSLIARMLQLKQQHPLALTGKLPDSIELKPERSLQCPKMDEFPGFAQKHPLWGMPYGMPQLTQKQEKTLLNWLQDGAKSDYQPSLSTNANLEIKKWEQFLNSDSPKQRLSFRYIYEHLYLGDLHFKRHPDNEFYKLVRSKTPTGKAIDEIKTVRPFDDPAINTFYYRFRPITSTIVDKDHFVYELSDNKMSRLTELFLKPEYRVTRLPGYDQASAANPFVTFSELPAMSRYQFMLDDAQFFFQGFIKGPVCMGQAALNVIRDQFWVAFIKPQNEYNQQSTQFLGENSQHLRMPASDGENIGFKEWRQFNELQLNYLRNKDAFVHNILLKNRSYDLDLIWNGDGYNENALLTVFRHYDNATVVKGLLGKPPLTAWVVDYPILERIHYLLVAGYNVFGTGGHQVTTRLYMDFLRMEAENNFLKFIPLKAQKPLHDSWYQGVDTKLLSYFEIPTFGTDKEPIPSYQSNKYVNEFFEKIQQQLKLASGAVDFINRCDKKSCIKTKSPTDDIMRKLANLKGKDINALPEVSFLRVKTKNPDKDSVYTLIRNKKLLNVSFIFAENLRREPENDTLTVIPGFIGSYPNVFFSIPQLELNDFIEQLTLTQTETERDVFYSHYGIRRTNPLIWEYYDWFNKKYLKEQPETAGLFDMNRYENL